MKKAVLYARVSSKEQEAEGFSIPSQLKLLREYAAQKGLVIEKEFVEAESAKKAGRTQFTAMLEFMRDSETVKHLLVEKTDRLSRNLLDAALIEELRVDNEVNIHCVKENTIRTQNANSDQNFFFGMNVLIAKKTSENLSEEVIKGMKEKAIQGTYPSHAPYGYINCGIRGKRSIEIDPVAALYVQKMFELYAMGTTSLRKLRKQMLDDGMVYRNGKALHVGTVEYILKNEFYTGVFYWNGVKCEHASHKPLISKELFIQVQRLLMNPHKAKSRKDLFPYTNLIRCGLCGCYLTAEIKDEKYIYYHCSGSKGKCKQPSLKPERIEAEFERVLNSIHITEEQRELIMQGLRESFQDKIEFHNETIEHIEKQIKVLQNRIDQTYIDKIDKKISEEFWQQNTAKWLAEKEELTAKLLVTQKADTSYLENANLILEIAEKASGLFKSRNAEEKRKLINLITSKCTYIDGKLDLELAKPFDMIMETKESEKWLPEQDSNLRPND